MQQTNFTNKQLEIINKAYAYAKANLYVLPGEIGKKYPYNGLVKGCSTVSYNIKDYPDILLLPELFKLYPDSNIIKLNGNDFNSVVIDIDKKDGKFSHEALAIIELLSDYPTYTVETPSGGLQYHYLIDPERPLRRAIAYKDGVDIIIDGASPLPPSRAYSKKISAVGEYVEKDSIDIQPITLFPYELFPDLIESSKDKKNITFKGNNWDELLTKMNPIGERNEAVCKLAGKLIKHLPKDDWDSVGWKLVQSYDKTNNDPPLQDEWGLNDLRIKFDGIKRAHILEQTQIHTEENTNQPQVVFWNELKDLKLPESTFLVDGLIVEKGINYLYGKPGVCKTWLVLYLVLCIAKGTVAFGRIKTKQCKVLIVDKDNDLYQMMLRVESLGGLDIDQVGYYSDAGLFRIENDEVVEKLLICIRKYDFKLVVFDTSRDIHKGEEDSSTHMDRVNQVFKRILHEGCAVLAISHTKKQDDGDLIDLIRGSTAISGSASSMIHLKQKDDNTVVLQMGKSRYTKKIEPMELKIIQNSGSITGFEYLGVANTEPPKKQSDEVEESILRLVKGIPCPGISRKDILQTIQRNGYPSESTLDRTIKKLVEKGLISKDSNGNVLFNENTS